MKFESKILNKLKTITEIVNSNEHLNQIDLKKTMEEKKLKLKSDICYSLSTVGVEDRKKFLIHLIKRVTLNKKILPIQVYHMKMVNEKTTFISYFENIFTVNLFVVLM